ncbi:LysR family transcriptional regulator [uncultured Cohaesibacter sp.]|uniref:LysR family transcriptional regulator n=1 Tax=uncultured Cohaesibacter sp. TaxID=1002546 RepID=UPI00292F79AC|nr:LysR family transcriptional regulator [uncultured Cohaesibacter sp.]
MEIRLLREYLVLSRMLNFSKAAEQLGMAQPVLSRHLKFLEEQFDTKLLNRSTQKVELTASGILLAERAEKIIAEYEETFHIIRDSLGKSQKFLTIMFLGAATREFFSDFLIDFQKQNEAMEIRCFDTDLDSIPGTLDRGECDIAFLVRPDRQMRDKYFQHFLLFKDPLCLAVHKNHPLAAKSEVSISEVSNWPYIGIDKNAAPLAGDCNLYFLEHYGVQFGPDIICPNLSTCCFQLELNEQAVVVMPKHQKVLLGKNTRIIDVIEKDCRFNVELIWDKKNRNPSIPLFLDELKNFLHDRPGFEV